MFLGIEIGGTKLQLGVGAGESGDLIALERRPIDASRGAAAILDQIESAASGLLQKHAVERIGVGFGGPVHSAIGIIANSHQVAGWNDFPMVAWCQQTLGRPTVIGNDCDAAALAEATYGAGQGKSPVAYVTVGTGVGGGLVVDGRLYGRHRPAVLEIGHLRPGLHADRPEATVESLASGWGIAAAVQARISGNVSRPLESVRRGGEIIGREQVRRRLEDARLTDHEYIADLLDRCQSDPELLTARIAVQAAAEGNEIAREVLDHAITALGWAIAQAITLLAPQTVVVGGGVSLAGEQMFFDPLRREAEKYVFPPLAGSYEIVPAALEELAVVHGAIALARQG